MIASTPERTDLVRDALRRLTWGFRRPGPEDAAGPPPLDPGTVARLRRGGGGASLDLWRVVHDLLKEEAETLLPDRYAGEAGRAWGLVLQGMALMAPDPHRWREAPGLVLARAGFSEPRLIRLLRAQGDAFPDAFTGACRFLRAKGSAVDWTEFGRFALERAGAPGVPDSGQTERIARDFVRGTRPAPASAPTSGAATP